MYTMRFPIKLLIGIFLILMLPLILFVSRHQQKIEQHAAVTTTDFTQYVNVLQSQQVFMRYPLGRIGLWSRTEGEISDSVTRNIRLYPLVDQTVSKDNTDWRNSIVAHPAETDITYNTNSPAKGSTVALAVTPNVAIYHYQFTNVSLFAAVGITLGTTAGYHGGGLTWTSNISIKDNQTIQATLVSGSQTVYYYIRFNVPGTGLGSGSQGYMQFSPSTKDVIVAVALSQTSMSQAQQNFTNEFSDFNFIAASQRLKDAWNTKLGKVDVQNADATTKQMFYTGLYTVYANIVNATDGSPYASNVAAYHSPLLTIGSSIGWAYIGGGYFRAAFDQGRSVYYLLTLLDPPLMTDILHTYQAQYDRDHVLLGNWDPYTPTAWNDQQWGFWGGMFTRAKMMGVTGVDYAKAESAIADTFGNTNNIMSKSGYLTKGYIPADGGVSNYMSRALDWSTDIDGLAKLANLLGDTATYNKFITYSQAYNNNWDATNKVFRAKNSDGSWAPLGNGGFFEGTAQTYGFDAPQDVLGLADLYGDANMSSMISTMLSSFSTDYGYNDYVPQYAFMPIYSNSPSAAQNIVRSKIIPQFNSLNMWEDSGGGDMYYTHNAGELVMGILGLYPYQAPGAEWVINSPAITTAVIHGIKDLTIQANNNSSSNIYVSSIMVNGIKYPSHFISGQALIAQNTNISLDMTSSASHIGNMYVTGTNGEIVKADSDNSTYLRFQNDPVTSSSRAKVYSVQQPLSVFVNNVNLTTWTYTASASTLDIKNIPSGIVMVCFTSPCNPAVTVTPPISTPQPTPSQSLSPTITQQVTPIPSLTGISFCGKSCQSSADCNQTGGSCNLCNPDTHLCGSGVTGNPTQTPAFSPSPIPSVTLSTTLGPTIGTLSVHFEGIDSQNNQKPNHPQRKVMLYFYKTTNFTNRADMTLPVVISFSPTDPSGSFINNNIDLSSIPQGSYYILAQSPEGSLREQLSSGLITVTTGQTIALNTPNNTSITLRMGDLNGDNIIDLKDYNILIDCYANKIITVTCLDHHASDQTKGLFSDINDDGLVNGVDYNIIIRNFGFNGY